MNRMAIAALIVAGTASAQISNFQTTPIDAPAAASAEAVDPFGNVWMVDPAGGALGKIDASGTYTAYPVPSDEHAMLYNLATTPDGSVWYADYAHPFVGRLSVKGEFFRYSVPAAPYLIAGGSDSGVFFNFLSRPQALGHLSADGAAYQQVTLPAGTVVEDLTVGPDGAAYFTDLRANHRIVRVGPDGVVQTFPDPVANPPVSFTWFPSITTGPDGNIWFSHATAIGRLRLTNGAVTEFPIPYASADASGITAGGDGNVWFADSLAGAGVVSQLVVSTATDDGHATINASPGIGEPIGILAIAPEPPGTFADVVRRADTAAPCSDPKFVVEQNRSSGANLQFISLSLPNPKCAEVEVSILEMRPAVDNSGEILLALAVSNLGPDPAEDVTMVLRPYGTTGIAFRFPGWDCEEAGAVSVCDRTAAMPAGLAELGEFDLTLKPGLEGAVVCGEVHSSTPDPTPANLIRAFSALGGPVDKVIPAPAPVAPPVSRRPQSKEEGR